MIALPCSQFDAIRALPTQEVDLPIVGEVDHWMLAQEVETGGEDRATAFCNKCGHFGPVDQHGQHNRPGDGRPCNYAAALTQAASPTGEGK